MTDTDIHWGRQHTAIDLAPVTRRGPTSRRETVTYGDWKFSPPKPIFEIPIPPKAGLFAILVRVGPWLWPLPQFEPIFFGEGANLYRRVVADGTGSFVRWLMHPKAVHGLYVSICMTHGLDKAMREGAVSRLLQRYRPDLTRSAEEFLAAIDGGFRIKRSGNAAR